MHESNGQNVRVDSGLRGSGDRLLKKMGNNVQQPTWIYPTLDASMDRLAQHQTHHHFCTLLGGLILQILHAVSCELCSWLVGLHHLQHLGSSESRPEGCIATNQAIFVSGGQSESRHVVHSHLVSGHVKKMDESGSMLHFHLATFIC